MKKIKELLAKPMALVTVGLLSIMDYTPNYAGSDVGEIIIDNVGHGGVAAINYWDLLIVLLVLALGVGITVGIIKKIKKA